MKECCENCEYWRKEAGSTERPINAWAGGVCARRSPAVGFEPAMPPFDSYGHRQRDWPLAVMPPTSHDYWCGDFTPLTTPAKDDGHETLHPE